MPTKTSTKQQLKLNKSLLKDLPYFNFRGNLALAHGQFNNSVNSELPTKRDLDNHHSLYDLDLFNLNMAFDTNQTDNDALMSQCIRSRYFSPHSLKQFPNNLTQDQLESSLSIFHNNIRSLNGNLENLVTHYLQEIGIHFNIIGVTETKIITSCTVLATKKTPQYPAEIAE